MNLFKERLKEISREFLEEEVDEETFAPNLGGVIQEGEQIVPGDMKWLAEQILIVR